MHKQVKRGVDFLDEHRPGWHRKIQLDSLNMKSKRECILGQVFGDFGEGKEELGIKVGAEYGFALPVGQSFYNHHLPWKELQSYWVEAINERLLFDDLESDIGLRTEEELSSALV